MNICESFKESLRGRGIRVVFPEGGDERIIGAARRIEDEGVGVPVLLGKGEEIRRSADQAGVDFDGLQTIEPKTEGKVDEYAGIYAQRRDNVTLAIARRIVRRPLYYGGMMTATNDAECMVGGVTSTTASFIQAGMLTVGLAEGIANPSSYFLMSIPEFRGVSQKTFIYADCAVNVTPGVEELADIAIASAESARKLLHEEPRVALLSFSTKGSASGGGVEKLHEALEIVRNRKPGLAIDGEFQVDTAIIAEVASRKLKEPSAVAGKANVLIFPDLSSGNIAYKLTQYMAGARAIGPLLQGFSRPLSDLSRGASVSDIVDTVVLTMAQLIDGTRMAEK